MADDRNKAGGAVGSGAARVGGAAGQVGRGRGGRPRLSDEERQALDGAPWRRRFLGALAVGLSVTGAAAEAKVSAATARAHRKADAAFRKLWDDAVECGTDVIEDEARRRAFIGWDEPVYVRGEVKGWIRRYSDRLIELLLKARRPEKYRDNVRLEHAGKVPGAVSPAVARMIEKAAGTGAPPPSPAAPADAAQGAGGDEAPAPRRSDEPKTLH